MASFKAHGDPTPDEIDAEVAALAGDELPELTRPSAGVDWMQDPTVRRELADEAARVLKLSAASRDTLRRYAANPPDEQTLRRDGAAFGALVDDALPALRREKLRVELLGLTEADIRRATADFVAGRDDATFPDGLAPAKPTGSDRRAIIRAISQFSPASRRRVFKTSNMLAIRGMVTAALVMLERERKQGGTATGSPAGAALRRPPVGKAVETSAAAAKPAAPPAVEPRTTSAPAPRSSLVQESGRAPRGLRRAKLPPTLIAATAAVLAVLVITYIVALLV